ncbi:MAG TPA: M48 family metallopeptidase [Fimbriimonadaceae bacterium]|nr:M48 family metallopeptidase [Fimbriimonadaceae bacterium]
MRPETAELEREIEESLEARRDFIAQVKREEERVAKDASGYRRSLYVLVFLAYAYIFAVLAVILGLFGAAIWLSIAAHGNPLLLRVALGLGILVVVIGRSLWVKIDPPKGVVLKRGDVSELYRMVDEIADRLQAPRPAEIRVDYRLNAAAAQVPRFGIFGVYRNVLVIGLPLLLGFPPDEVRSVIAHEFGHFSGAHGEFGAWAYRVDQTWRRIIHQLARRRSLATLAFYGFVKWFPKRFAAKTFALRRAHEYEADKAAAEIGGAECAARALLRLRCLGPELRRGFWKDLSATTKDSPVLPANCLAGLSEAARKAGDPETMAKDLTAALAETTSYQGSHPALSDRLRALGQMPESVEDAVRELSAPIERTAAEAFIGPRLPSLIGRVESAYAAAAKPVWEEHHGKIEKLRSELEALRARAEKMPLSEKEQVELAYATYRIDGIDAARPEFVRLRMEFPTNPVVAFWLGRILAQKQEPGAEALLKEATRGNPRLVENAFKALDDLYRAQGRQDDRESLEEGLARATELRKKIGARALKVAMGDAFQPHNLTEEKVQRLVEGLPAHSDVRRAYLMRKLLPNGETRLVLVAIRRKRFLDQPKDSTSLRNALVKGLKYPEMTTVVVPHKDVDGWDKRLSRLRGALVYSA